MAEFCGYDEAIAGMQQEFWKQVPGYWSGIPGAASAAAQVPADGADSDDASPRKHGATTRASTSSKRSYLAYSSFLQNTVESAPVDEKTRANCAMACGNSSTP